MFFCFPLLDFGLTQPEACRHLKCAVALFVVEKLGRCHWPPGGLAYLECRVAHTTPKPKRRRVVHARFLRDLFKGASPRWKQEIGLAIAHVIDYLPARIRFEEILLRLVYRSIINLDGETILFHSRGHLKISKKRLDDPAGRLVLGRLGVRNQDGQPPGGQSHRPNFLHNKTRAH